MRSIDVTVPWADESEGYRRIPGYPPIDEPKGGGGATFEFFDLLTIQYWDILYTDQNWTSGDPQYENSWWKSVWFVHDLCKHNGVIYLCILKHFSDQCEPGVSENSSTYWRELGSYTWKGEWADDTAYSIDDLVWMKDKWGDDDATDHYGFGNCTIAHTSSNDGYKDNRPTRWADVENTMFVNPLHYVKVDDLSVTIDDCGFYFWNPLEILLNYYQGWCQWNMGTITSELATSNEHRWSRKPLGLVTSRDSDKRWDMSNELINLRLQLRTKDNTKIDVSPDLDEDGDIQGSARVVDVGDTGSTPAQYSTRNIGSKVGLKIIEEGARTLAHYFSKDGEEVNYGFDWLDPFSLRYQIFDTADEDNIKVTRELDYNADDVSGKFIDGFRKGQYEIYLMPRLIAYSGRSAERYQENENIDVIVEYECHGVDPPYYGDTLFEEIEANCSQYTWPCAKFWWGGFSNPDVQAASFSDAIIIDGDLNQKQEWYGPIENQYPLGTYCCQDAWIHQKFEYVVGTGWVQYYYQRWCEHGGLYTGGYCPIDAEDCPDPAGPGPSCSSPDSHNIALDVYREMTYRRPNRPRTYAKHHLGLWWDRLPNQFTLSEPSDFKKTTPTFCVKPSPTTDYEVQSVLGDESLEDALANAISAGMSQDDIEFLCGFNSIHVFGGIGDDDADLGFVTTLDEGEGDFCGDAFNYRSIPSGKSLDTTELWGAREIFDYEEFTDPDKIVNWNLIWSKMRATDWIRNYYYNAEDDQPGDLLLQGNYDEMDYELPWGIGFTPNPPGTLLAVVRQKNTDNCWYIWQKQQEEITTRKVGTQFPGANYDEVIPFYELLDYKTRMEAKDDDSLDSSRHWPQFSGTGRHLTNWGRGDDSKPWDDRWDAEHDVQCDARIPESQLYGDTDQMLYGSDCGIKSEKYAGSISIGESVYVIASNYVNEFE